MRKAGKAAFVLIVAGVVLLFVAVFASPLFAIAGNQSSGVVALVLLIGGVVLLAAGLVLRFKAPKDMPDEQYDHDLPNN
jgi:protein-S-isoprenylcysteine O-methyltransferase Ste14